MINPKVTSLLLKLQHAKALEVNDVLEELLQVPDASDSVLPVVERRIDDGAYFVDNLLASLILATHSESLYNRVRKNLLKNDSTALKLYKGQYPDSTD